MDQLSDQIDLDILDTLLTLSQTKIICFCCP